MWERHVDMYNIEPRPNEKRLYSKPNAHGLHVDLGNKKPIEQSIKEVVEQGRSFTATELHYHFGFTREMIFKFRKDQERQKRWLAKPEAERQAIALKEERLAGREKRIIEMRMVPMTYAEIGSAENLTRERVRQILLKCEKKYGVELTDKRKVVNKQPDLLVAIRCRYCRKIVEVLESEKDKWRMGFCKEHRVSPTIWGFIQAGAEWYGATDAKKENIRYHFDPKRKERGRFMTSRWRNNLKKDPVKWAEFRAKEDAYQKIWHAKRAEEAKAKKEAERLAKIRPFIEVPDNGQDFPQN